MSGKDNWKWAAGIGAATVGILWLLSGRSTRNRRTVSVWWDVQGPPTLLYLDKHIANLKALGISSVSIMLTDPDGSSNFTDHELDSFTAALRANGITFGLDVWSHPSRRFVASLPELSFVARGLGAQFIEFDTEANWESSRLEGYSSLDEAADGVAGMLSGSRVPWGITTNMGRLSSTALTLGRHGRFVVPQAYSTAGTDDPMGVFPGSYQTRSYNKTRTLYGDMPIVMGLAAFDQELPGWNPTSAMLAAARASFGLDTDGVRFWSWKWIGGSDGTPRNRYAFTALAWL